MPSDKRERVDFALNLYKRTLDFLIGQGGCLAHVKPEYLLSYEDFETFNVRNYFLILNLKDNF